MMDISKKSLATFSSHLLPFDAFEDEEDGAAYVPELRPYLYSGVRSNPSSWSTKEVMNWFIDNYPSCCLEHCAALRGSDLLNMGEADFEEIVPRKGHEILMFFAQFIDLDSRISKLSSDLDMHIDLMINSGLFAQEIIDEKHLTDLQPMQIRSDNGAWNNPTETKAKPDFLGSVGDENNNNFAQYGCSLVAAQTTNSDNSYKRTYTNKLTWSGGTVHYPSDLSAQNTATVQPPVGPIPQRLEDSEKIKKKKKVPPAKLAPSQVKVKEQSLPVKPKTEKIRLCVFMRQLLENPEFNPSLVKWIDAPQGIFQIVRSKCVAEMWGKAKNNRKNTMTFEKLGRSLRWCRDKDREFKKLSKSSQDIPKKLCFQLTL